MARQDNEPPLAARWGWRFHHLGIPTNEVREGEHYLPQFKMYVSGFAESPYGVEWMRFEAGSPIPDVIKTLPHLAFEVGDLDAALEGKTIVFPPASPSPGVTAAMIIDNGCPIELIHFER